MFRAIIYVFILLGALIAISQDAKAANEKIVAIANGLIDSKARLEEKSNSDLNALNEAILDDKFIKASSILKETDAPIDLLETYHFVIELSIDDVNSAEEISWLENCVATKPPILAHNCATGLAKPHIINNERSASMQWAIRSAEVLSEMEYGTKEYWLASYKTSYLLYMSYLLDRNLEKTLNAVTEFVEAKNQVGISTAIYPIINNIVLLENKIEGPEKAWETLQGININLDGLDKADKEIILYTLGKVGTEANQYEKSIGYLNELNRTVEHPGLKKAHYGYFALSLAKTGKTKRAEDVILESRQYYKDGFTGQSGARILQAQKELSLSSKDFKQAYELEKKISEINEAVWVKTLSDDQRRLASELEASNEKLASEQQRLKLELTITEEKEKTAKLVIASLIAFGLLLLTLVIFLRRSRDTALALNNKLEIQNAQIVKSQEELIIANDLANAGLRAKEKFIGVVGHELRTPLNPIINMARILADKADNPSDKESLEAIYDGGQRLHMTIENMIAVSNETYLVYREKTDLVLMVCNIMEDRKKQLIDKKAAAQKSGSDFTFKVSKSKDFPDTFSTGKIMLDRVLINIIDNAIKFTSTGHIHINLLLDADQRARIEILDTGSGISKQAIREIFEPFSQENEGLSRSHEGSGLGLTVAQKYLKALNGRIEIESELGAGTLVAVVIPETFNENKVKLAKDDDAQGDINFRKSA